MDEMEEMNDADDSEEGDSVGTDEGTPKLDETALVIGKACTFIAGAKIIVLVECVCSACSVDNGNIACEASMVQTGTEAEEDGLCDRGTKTLGLDGMGEVEGTVELVKPCLAAIPYQLFADSG